MSRPLRFLSLGLAVCLAVAVVPNQPARTQGAAVEDGNHNFDRRLAHNSNFKAARAMASSSVAAESLASEVSDLAVNEDETTGVVSSLSSHTGYLTGARSGEPMAIAVGYVRDHLD